MYGEELFFTPKFLKAKEMADAGAFGKIHLVKQSEKHFGPHSPWFWNVERSGGGTLMDLGCHGIAFCYWFLGRSPIKSVYCQMGTYVHGDKTKAEDESLCILEFANGAVGLVEDSWGRRGGMDDRIEVFGDAGVTYANLHMGNALPVQRKRLRLRGGKSADHYRLDLSGVRRTLELRHAAGADAFRALRSRQRNAASHRRRWLGSAARNLCRLRFGRRRPQDRDAVPAAAQREKAYRSLAEWQRAQIKSCKVAARELFYVISGSLVREVNTCNCK